MQHLCLSELSVCKIRTNKEFESFYLHAKIKWQKDESLQSLWAFACVCSQKPACLYMWFLLSFDVCDERKFENFISIFCSSKMTEIKKSITLFDDQYKLFKAFNSSNLLIAFVEYMFEDKQPEWLNDQEQVIFESLIVRMNNLKNKSKAWSKSRWWWRPPKTTEEQEKSKTKTTEKQQKNNTKTTEKQEEQEQVKVKEEENTNIILSNDTETKVSEYWNHDINECLDLIKSFNWWLIDWTIKNNRKYAKLLIDKLNKLDSIKEWRYTRQSTLSIILDVISKNKYHASKITSSESIYRNLAVLMQACKNDIWKAQTSSIILPTI